MFIWKSQKEVRLLLWQIYLIKTIQNDYEEKIMADKIVRKYNVSAQGILTIDEDGRLYVSCEDGAQDVSLAKLLEDFNDRQVKISCNYDEEYSEEDEVEVGTETGEII